MRSVLRILDVIQLFFSTFSVFLTKFLLILIKHAEIVNCSDIEFISKERVGFANCYIRVFWQEFKLNFSKFRLFFVKTGKKSRFFSPLALNLLKVDTLKL